MTKQKFGIAVEEETVDEIDEIVDKCADLEANRSEVIEVILMAYLDAKSDQVEYIYDQLATRREETP